MFRRTLFPLYLFLVSATLWGAPPALDPGTVTGTLDNGIRYFILPNPKPENRVELRLVVQAGSLQESPREKGLAHLVEHMQFEGTEHFGSQEIVNFLESNGMRFGADLNANTGWTTTQYFLKLPADKPEVLTKGLAILEDWAHGPIVDPGLLEKEKKIVAEENRLWTQNVRGRLQLAAGNDLNEGTVYEDHLPLGDMALVQAVTPADVRRFVDTWYTPKAMSLVVVGAVDPASVEKTLKSLFKEPFANAGRPGPVRAAPRPESVTDQAYFFKDPELNTNGIAWAKVEHPPVHDLGSMDRWYLISEVALGALNKRLEALGRQTGSGIQGCSVDVSWDPWPEALFYYGLTPLEGQNEKAVAAFMTEIRKAAVLGITENEFQLGVKGWNDEVEARLTQKDNVTDDQQADQIAEWIVTGQPVTSIAVQYDDLKAAAKALTRDQVNAWLARYLVPTRSKVLVSSIDKPGAQIPTAADLADWKSKALGAQVSATNERNQKALVEVPPVPGRITAIEPVAGSPFTRWTLSNGIRVYVYKNSFTRNGFNFQAFAPGGLSAVTDGEFYLAAFSGFLTGSNGLGNLDQTQLQDFLTGKKASLNWTLENFRATLSGTSNPADPTDMERFFEVLYERFVSNRRDPGAEASNLAKAKEWVTNNQNTPNQLAQNALEALDTGGNPRFLPFTSQRFGELDLDRAAAIQARFFSNPGAFTFLITGDYDEPALKKLVETWVASLPATPSDQTVKDLGIRPAPGPVTRVVNAGHDQKSAVNCLIQVPFPYTPEDWHRGSILREIVEIRLREVLRQDKGGVYGVSVSAEMAPDPYPYVQTFIQFTCAPENREALVKAMNDELQAISSGQISDEVFAKAVEIRTRDEESQSKTNDYWAACLYWGLVDRDDLAKATLWTGFYKTVKKDGLKTMAAQCLDPKNALTVILEPQKP